jgi:hypothetical protein
VALANAAGGNDNSTAVVIFFETEPEDAALRQRAMFNQSADAAESAEGDEPPTTSATDE